MHVASTGGGLGSRHLKLPEPAKHDGFGPGQMVLPTRRMPKLSPLAQLNSVIRLISRQQAA
jgi:hypothetical protein